MRLATIAVILLSVSASGYAQTMDPELERAQQARNAARLGGDEQTWGRYTTDDFVTISPSGQLRTKTERMAEIKGNKVATRQPNSSDRRLRVYGDAVIRTERQELTTGAVLLTEVWSKQGGTWKVTHVQFTPVQKP